MAAASSLAPRIWGLCDVLRDDGITYHQYINELSYLLFLKMAAENGVEKDLPRRCRWRALADAAPDDQFDLYRRILVELGTSGDGVVKEIFANPTSLLRRAKSLRMLVAGIDSLDWHAAGTEGFGDIYEELLRYSAEKRSGAGQYFTPRELVETIVRVTQPTWGEVVQDPALGTAGFLVAAHDHVSKAPRRGRPMPSYVGVELVQDNYRLALMNTFIHGMEGTYLMDDTLGDAGRDLPPADVILTNPPFGSKRGGAGVVRSDLPFATQNKQFAFLQHVVLKLKPGGRAAVVVPDNVLFEGGVGLAVRERLMADCNLHTVLRLPSGIFYAAGVKTNVLFFTRGTPTTSVWFYDARTGAQSLTRKDRPLTRAHFAEFERCYGSAADGTAPRSATDSSEDRWREVSLAQIRAAGGNLDRFKWLAEGPETSQEALEPEQAARRLLERVQALAEELGGLADYLDETNRDVALPRDV